MKTAEWRYGEKMRICIVVEGSYPYIMGGVSSWVHMLMTKTPEAEFVVQALITDRSLRGKFRYQLPENVVEVREIYIQDADWIGRQGKEKVRLNTREKAALRSLIFSENVMWGDLFDMFQEKTISINGLLMGNDFYDIVKEYYEAHYNRVLFTDFLWTLRSMYLPMLQVLKDRPVKADLYHSVAAGYSGLWASMAKHVHQVPYILSEHGIYTREREEEIIKADWVKGIYKDIWIAQFSKFSLCAYQFADHVISLFEAAKKLEIEFGCPEYKASIIPNGINAKRFENIARKDKSDRFIHVGTVLRVTPVKDVKTMIHAFYYARKKVQNLRLWIMGPLDEQPAYAHECMDIAKTLCPGDIEFTGAINVLDYIGKMDIFLLTSISEGQPLSILEAFAAKVPCIATNVGNCQGVIYGDIDNYGEAGIVAPIMSIAKIADAIVKLAENEALRKEMGEAGYRRVVNSYAQKDCLDRYHSLYQELYNKKIEADADSKTVKRRSWFCKKKKDR
jgi:glycosyltransferase involved in cell wall biosynthesis